MRSTMTAMATAIQKMLTYISGPPSLKKRTMLSLTLPPETGAAARTTSMTWFSVESINGVFLSERERRSRARARKTHEGPASAGVPRCHTKSSRFEAEVSRLRPRGRRAVLGGG